MRLELITPPAAEPVTAAEAKAHARIDTTADDSLVTALIIAARKLCENYTQCAFINQTWQYNFDIKDEPTCDLYIPLPMGKIQSITSINSYDSDNVSTTFSTSAYRLSGKRIVLNDNYDWPTLDRYFDSLIITYVAGFGTSASNVPQEIKQAIMMTVAHLYENREALIDPMGAGAQEVMLPLGLTALLMPYKNFVI